jgi:hypothetical protein
LHADLPAASSQAAASQIFERALAIRPAMQLAVEGLARDHGTNGHGWRANKALHPTPAALTHRGRG